MTASPEVHTFDWFVERLAVDHWNSETPGKRDCHANCPVHGGSDSLHVTEKNGKALIKCFAADCTYEAVVAALEDAEPEPVPATRRRKVGSRPAYTSTGVEVAKQEGVKWVPPLRPRGISPSWLHGGLARLDDVPDDTPIVFTEGHGPAIALNAIGIPVVCSVTGQQGTIDDTGASFLLGRRVILSPDKGADAHTDRCGTVIAKVAAEVLVAPSWPDEMEEGEDAADFIARFGPDAMRDHYDKARPWKSTAIQMSRPMSEVQRYDPEPLVDDFAHPSQHTGLWGPNGAGKGVFAAWKIAARTRAGQNVLLLDYEGHEGEWRSRLEDFGADLSRVHIALPLGLEGGMLEGAIWDQKEALAAEVDRVGADWLYVDTVSAACGVADITDTTAPTPYFAALNAIGIPSVSIGHVTKAEALEYPFGSMLWRAFIRMGWSFAGTGDRRELVNRKTNDYPSQKSVTFDWAWSDTYRQRSVPPTLTPVDMAAEVNASLLAQVEGIPSQSEDPEGMTEGELGILWSMRAPARRIAELVKGGLLRRSDALVKTGRSKAWKYWRVDVGNDAVTIQHRPNVPARASVAVSAGVTTLQGGNHARSDQSSTVEAQSPVGASSEIERGDDATPPLRRPVGALERRPPRVKGDTDKEGA